LNSDNEYGQDYFTLKRIYVEEQGPKSIHMHWRRFAVKDIPTADPKAFDTWLLERYREKDVLLDFLKLHGRFPTVDESPIYADGNSPVIKEVTKTNMVSSHVGPYHAWEIAQIFASLLTLPIFWYVGKWLWWFVSLFRG
jgi:lysocardiolipin and lysophospholipid acyltransferase